MTELYRLKLIGRYLSLVKSAQTSGPWANLDLPIKERVWEWDEGEEEYFANREESRKAQTRYNPSYTKDGYYLIWPEPRRDPYRFTDMLEEDPVPHRSLMAIP